MNNSLTYIDYYVGSYGDTIRISTQSKDWIISLKEKIKDIFDGNIQNFDICQLPNIKCFDSIGSLELIKVEKSYTPCVILKRVDEKNNYTWTQDVEGIETLLGLIDGLIVDDSPGHQYLLDAGDNCVIELCYNED